MMCGWVWDAGVSLRLAVYLGARTPCMDKLKGLKVGYGAALCDALLYGQP
jgi:hypothetical protein